VLTLVGYGFCGVLGGLDPAYDGGIGSFGYEAALPLGLGHGYGIPHGPGIGYGYGKPNDCKNVVWMMTLLHLLLSIVIKGYGHGHGYGLGGHYSRPAALYDSHNAWKPIIKKPLLVKPYIAPIYKPIVPLYKPSLISITPSLSYGYSYKLIPTGGYGPDLGHGLGVEPGLGYGFGHGYHHK